MKFTRMHSRDAGDVYCADAVDESIKEIEGELAARDKRIAELEAELAARDKRVAGA